MTSLTHRRPVVGREPELRQLRGAFDAAAAGHGALVLVVGEPGIGKTTVCEHLAAYAAAQGGQVLTGHCYEEGALSLPYLPFVEALRTHVLARESEPLRAELGETAPDIVRILPELRGRIDTEPAPPGDPEYDRYRLLQSVVGFFCTIAAAAPLLLVLEDLHDADRGTLDLLIHLARQLSDARLLVVGTYRDVEVDRAHPLSGALAELRRAADFERLALRGLSPDEVQRMMERLADRDLPRGLAGAVHRQTEGNPLFIQEVLRFLSDAGRLGRTGEADLLAVAIPEGLRDVIGKRLSRLSADCNRVLAVAAVVGREFDLATLEAVASIDEEGLLVALEEAVRAAVLEEQARPGEVRYRFAHAFVRQTLYEELIAPRRLRLHQQVARALEARHARRLDEHVAELAEHFAHSTDPADLEKAVDYGERAAERASSVYAYGEAVRLLEQALQVQEVLDPDDRARRCDLLLRLGEALLPTGEPKRVIDVVAPAAFEVAESLEDHARASRACQLALMALINYGWAAMIASPEYRLWTERADRHAAPDSIDRVQADIALSDVALAHGDILEVWPLRSRALDLARHLGDPETLFAAAYEIINSPAPLFENERLGLVEEFIARPREGVSARTLARLLWRSGLVLLSWGDRERAEVLWRQVADLAERTRNAYVLLLPMIIEGRLAALDGELERALATLERLADRSEELGSAVIGRSVSLMFGRLPRLYLGHALPAPAAEPADASPLQAGFRWTGLLDHARATAMAGRRGEASALLGDFLAEHAPRFAEGNTYPFVVVGALEVAALTGDIDAVRELVPAAARLAQRATLDMVDETCPARHLGAAAALLGDRTGARASYAQALELTERIRYRPEIALIRLQLAELLHDGSSADRAEAREHLTFAIGELQEMKMRPALERALRLRDRAGGGTPAPALSRNPDDLSDREVEVLRGIAAGQSNQAIADALVVSVRTVERHAVNIYATIGARGRTDAVAYAVRHGLADTPPP